MSFKLKSGNKPQFKQVGSSPTKHYVDDVAEHNDGHSDNLQTPEEHKSGKEPTVREEYNRDKKELREDMDEFKRRNQGSPAKQAKRSGLGPRTSFGGVKNPELVKDKKKPFSKKVMIDGPKNRVHGIKNPGNWQAHQFRDKKSPAKQTDATYADGSKKSKREQDFSKRHTAEKAKDKYWYKIDGKKATKAQYLKYENKPGDMEGGGKQTNHPDVYGRIANNHGRGPKTKK
tara:strand:- start:432 stop:1121 length:690 start_codon:yes stop_codon:yes gene_type:complete